MDILTTELPLIKEHSLLIPLLGSLNSPVKTLTTIHRQYGDLVRCRFFNKKLLFVCQPENIQAVYAQEARGLLSRDYLYEAKKSLFGDGLVNSKSDTWTQQRRLMQPIFSKEAVSVWEQVFIHEATSAHAKLLSAIPGKINLSKVLKRLIQRIFIQVLTGRSVDTLSNSDALIQAIESISKGMLPHLVAEMISNGKLMLLMPGKSRAYHAAVDYLSNFVRQEIIQNQAGLEQSLISAMGQAVDGKTGYRMTKALLTDEAINLFFAGQDTTVNTLSWFFYLLGQNERVHDLVTAEVKSYRDEPLTAENVQKYTYTRATLCETLRLFPSAAALSTQAIADIEIGRQRIDKHTIIILSMYVTHRHPALWEKPNDFYPEHFLNPLADKRHKYAYFAFGGGLHNCIGRHFAELEMMIIIVTLLRALTFKTSGGIRESASITLKPAQDIIATVSLC
ncbi:cytochrome P450 [Methylomonas sp. MgM2]